MSCIVVDGSNSSFGEDIKSISPNQQSKRHRIVTHKTPLDLTIKSGSFAVAEQNKKRRSKKHEEKKHGRMEIEKHGEVNYGKIKRFQNGKPREMGKTQSDDHECHVTKQKETKMKENPRKKNKDSSVDEVRSENERSDESKVSADAQVLMNSKQDPSLIAGSRPVKDNHTEILRLQQKMAKLQNKIAHMQKQVLSLQSDL